MILYRLRCNDDHEFEGWFRNAAAFDQQRDSGTLECPVCGTGAVSKALMAPSIAKGREPATAIQAPAPEVQAAAEMQAMHPAVRQVRSEEHTSELQSLMRISYAVFCLKKKNKKTPN